MTPPEEKHARLTMPRVVPGIGDSMGRRRDLKAAAGSKNIEPNDPMSLTSALQVPVLTML